MTAVQERPDLEEREETRERVTIWGTGELLYVHPVAACFRRLGGDELEALAEDIRRNGLTHPVVLDQHRQVLDGRNRLEACRRAEVAPDFVEVVVEDPLDFILAANEHRRHDSKGQRAMSVAKALLVSNTRQVDAARTAGASQARISQANSVLTYAPELADAVRDGAISLDAAYATAQDRKREQASTSARMAALQAAAPDLADQVVEQTLTLNEAEAALRQRQADERAHKVATTRLLLGVLLALEPGSFTPAERASALLAGFDPALVAEAASVDAPHLRACASVLDALIARLPQEVDP